MQSEFTGQRTTNLCILNSSFVYQSNDMAYQTKRSASIALVVFTLLGIYSVRHSILLTAAATGHLCCLYIVLQVTELCGNTFQADATRTIKNADGVEDLSISSRTRLTQQAQTGSARKTMSRSLLKSPAGNQSLVVPCLKHIDSNCSANVVKLICTCCPLCRIRYFCFYFRSKRGGHRKQQRRNSRYIYHLRNRSRCYFCLDRFRTHSNDCRWRFGFRVRKRRIIRTR